MLVRLIYSERAAYLRLLLFQLWNSASDNSSQDESYPEPTPVLAPVQPVTHHPSKVVSQSFPKISAPRDLQYQPQPKQYVKHRSLNFQHEQVSIGGRHDPPTYDLLQSLRKILKFFSDYFPEKYSIFIRYQRWILPENPMLTKNPILGINNYTWISREPEVPGRKNPRDIPKNPEYWRFCLKPETYFYDFPGNHILIMNLSVI